MLIEMATGKRFSLQKRDQVLRELKKEYPDKDTFTRFAWKISELQGNIKSLTEENTALRQSIQQLREEKKTLQKRVKELEMIGDRNDHRD
jgi:predicted nuclease with TOPRIM domain